MFPLRDTQRSSRFPLVTLALIVANVAVFVWELSMSPEALEAFVGRHGLIPIGVTEGWSEGLASATAEVPLRFLSCMFIHAGFLHILGNLWVLWIFGDNVEDRMGHARYLAFYLLCGVAAGIAHVVTNPNSAVPTIGASGAIAGVLGAYLILFPRARVLTLVPVFVLPVFMELPAMIFLGVWFLLQLLSGQKALGQGAVEGVAWWAHVGGFLFGIVTYRFFVRRGRGGLP